MPTKGRGQTVTVSAGGATVADAGGDDADLRGRVEKVLEAIRPAVQSDGGDLELVEITADRLVRIRMLGACIGCPSSMITLKMGVERNMKLYVPEIAGVEAVQ